MTERGPGTGVVAAEGFEPPVYPYERLASALQKASAHEGGAVDLSIGTPGDPPPPGAVSALSSSGAERGYPASAGSPAYRDAAASWLTARLGVQIEADQVAACVGTKEFVASAPRWLRLRDPGRDTVLYPSLSYPSYEMGAVLAGCRPVPVRVDEYFRLDLDSVSDGDARRALLLWVNSPGNPAGQLEDLGKVASWGRQRGVPVLSDECYLEFTWRGSPKTILQHGSDGVLAVHSVSKRSNLAGIRAGFYAGDPSLVRYLSEVRKHAGLMVPGPVQSAAAVALGDEEHVEHQRKLYSERLAFFSEVLAAAGASVRAPEGGFYLWARVPPAEDGASGSWSFTCTLAAEGGALVSPGDLYGDAGAGYVRAAMVQPLERLELVASRLGLS